jgi:hypothetical protein
VSYSAAPFLDTPHQLLLLLLLLLLLPKSRLASFETSS